jgi:hypothetical protein
MEQTESVRRFPLFHLFRLFRVLTSFSFDKRRQRNPSFVIGILRFVLKHIAAGETQVFKFLL